MKFHWFHGMPWPHLPPDFRDRSNSVWVDVDSRYYDPIVGHRLYHEYLDQMEYAEQVGFDGLIVNEHHQNAVGLMPSPQLMAAALARRTTRAAIIMLGTSLPLYNPPTRLAEELAMLDVLSGGRLVAGLPVGTTMDACFAYGANPATIRDRYREHHDLVMRALSEPEPFAWNGEFSKLRYVNIWPRPIQQPIPVWIPGGGSAETWDFCAEMGYSYSCLSFDGRFHAEEVLDAYWSRLAELAVPFNPYQGAVNQTFAVAETDAEARERYDPHLHYNWYVGKHLDPRWANAPGYTSERTMRESGAATQAPPTPEPSFDERIASGTLIAGSPESVTEQVEDLVKRLRVGHLIGVFQFGDMPTELTNRNTRLFAEHVIPRLRHLWGEYVDHWSPTPLNRPEAIGRDQTESKTSEQAETLELAGIN